MSEIKYCPTQNGIFTGYIPEYKHGKEWKKIPIKVNGGGFPFPAAFGGILRTIHLYGYEQANALRYAWKAHWMARGRTVITRIVQYEITYNIKARKLGV